MTLNGLLALILRYFAEFNILRGRYVTVVEDRSIRFSAEYSVAVISLPKLTHAAVARSLCDS